MAYKTVAQRQAEWLRDNIPPPKVPKLWGNCRDCGEPIWEDECVWWVGRSHIACLRCAVPYQDAVRGHLWWAGLELPGIEIDWRG